MAVEPTRVCGHISWELVEARLTSTRSMVLSTTRPDGRPHAIPTWFWWAGDGRLYFITARSTQKARNLAVESAAVAHLGDGDDVLFLEGSASVVTDSDEAAAADASYKAKYIDPVSGASASIFDNPADQLYRIDVARIVTWMYGTVGGWTEWRFPSSEGGPSAG